MNFVTKVVTTYFFASIRFIKQAIKAIFCLLLRERGVIYGAYCHQNKIELLITLLN